jgi:hypothetical protein
MTSGAWITLFLFGGVALLFIIGTPWEFLQLYRHRKGNKSALTISQYVVRKAEGGSKFWRFMVVAFPIFLIIVGLILLFHWEGLQWLR